MDFQDKENRSLEELEKIRSKNRKADQNYRRRQTSNSDTAEIFRKRRAEISRRSYAKKKLKLCNNILNNSSQNVLRNRAEAVKFVQNIGNELNLSVTEKPRAIIQRYRQEYEEASQLAREFYEFDNISKQLPGKKDFVKVVDPESLSTSYKQKRVMLMSLSKAYEEFIKSYPHIKLKLTKFKYLRPKHVVTMSKVDHIMCCCYYCESMKSKIEALQPFKKSQSFTIYDVMKAAMCDRYNYECAAGFCEDCPKFESLMHEFIKSDCNEEIVRLSCWEKVRGFMQRVIKVVKVNEVVKMFDEDFDYYRMHKYVESSQFEYFNQVKRNLSPDEALIIVDYSQNYSCTTQNEVQSAFFAKHQISVFTAYAYIGDEKPEPYVIVNDDISHSKEQVAYYLRVIIDDLKVKFPNISHVRILSDGCAAQFKNKFILSNLVHAPTDYGVTAEWSFFPTSHGKSPADGLGGTFKRLVYFQVMSGRWEVNSALEFYECAKSFAKGTNILHINKEDVLEWSKNILIPRWKNVKNMKGTRNFHYFAPSSETGKIEASVSSRQEQLHVFKL